MLALAAAVLVAYGLGSIPFAYLLARARGVDVRRAGSGNVGATNVWRTTGAVTGLGALVLDAGKGALAVLLAARLGPSPALPAVAGLAAVAGHVFPIWLGFHGGKGVATGAGVLAVLVPGSLVAGVAVFGGVLWAGRYVSLASCVAAMAAAAATVAAGAPWDVSAAVVAIAGLVVTSHRANLARLRLGSEPRLALR